MNITLYKNCKLNNQYNEVLDVFVVDALTNTNAFQDYISALEQLGWSYTFTEIPDTYISNSGTLTFEMNVNNASIYNYNYMKISDSYMTRYCFINDIKIVNGLAVVSYEEDIWSTYASSMELRSTSLLTRSKVLSYTKNNTTWNVPFYRLPMEYEGNNLPDIYTIYGDDISSASYTGEDVDVFFTISAYTGSRTGLVNTRQTYTLLFDAVKYGTGSEISVKGLSIGTIINYIENVFIHASDGKFDYESASSLTYNYEIEHIYVIPKYLGFESLTYSSTRFVINYDSNYHYLKILQGINSTMGKLVTLYQNSIVNNFINISVGTMYSQYPIISNGSTIDVDIKYEIDDYELKLYLVYQNQIIDITKDFELEIPISVQGADITQQQKIARELRNVSYATGLAGNIAGLGTSIASLGTGLNYTKLGQLGASSGAMSGLQALGYVNQGQNMQMSGGTGIVSSAMGIVNGVSGLIANNKSIFTTNKGLSITNKAIVNAYYGIVILKINPDNTTEVNNSINNTGYVCNEFVKNEVFAPIGVSTSYNVLKFDNADINGNFTQAIRRSLLNVLTQGFKIWYSASNFIND